MDLKEKVKKSLDKTRSYLQSDGGDVELVNVTEDGVVSLKLKGACSGCPMATMTLKNGIEKQLKKDVPEITQIKTI